MLSFCLSISILSSSVPRNVFPGVLLLLNHNIKQNAPPETSHAACYVFLLSLLHTLVTPPHSSPAFTTHDVRPCPDSLVSHPSPDSLMCFRLFLKSHSGTAGRQSSLVIHGADFSTKDMDNDNCMCKCALMLTGGKCKTKQKTKQHTYTHRKTEFLLIEVTLLLSAV